MECLHCKKEFTPKRGSAKFCSDNCRVRFHLKKVKTEKEQKPPLTFQVILNRMETVLEKIEGKQMNQYDAPKLDRFINDEPPKWEQPIITRKPKSVVKYVSERLQIETPEGFEIWSEELESDPFLSDRDKKDARTKIL